MADSSAVERFMPMDRRQALAAGNKMPVRTSGAVLFADVSGFTPLTGVLNNSLGPQRGAEELTRQLNRVFEVLIAPVHLYGGSVIIFSGDAITCWFEGDNGRRATTCAFEMQRVMEPFETITTQNGLEYSIALKVAVTVGKTNRYLVGHSHIQRLEALAGATIDRCISAEQLIHKGEIIVGAEVLAWFGSQIRVEQWRSDDRGEYFAIVKSSRSYVETSPWPAIKLKPGTGREWLLPPVAERVLRGEGDFLAQIRSSVAFFLRFGGIDYDTDPEAGGKLDAYIRWVQTVLAQYEGFLLELTIGDKGSYLYIVFGTPLTHENDPARSISAALDLQNPPPGLAFIGPVQIGISQGIMRAGAYGSSQRRSYGVQGQEVNIAARLMSHAEPGQILVSGRILKATASLFEYESLGDISLKGLQAPMSAYRILRASSQPFGTLTSDTNTIPLVGRKQEQKVFRERLSQLLAGQGSTLIIEGEAGIGKSRLAAEFLQEARQQGVEVLSGVGNEVSQSVTYHGWQTIFQHLFGLKAGEDTERAWDRVTEYLDVEANPALLQRLPLLSVILPFHIPDSELTHQMSGDIRANNTHDLLVSILYKASQKRPILLLLEEAHWLDSASWAMIERLQWQEMPLLLIVVSRPFGRNPDEEETADYFERLISAPHTDHLVLKPLTVAETIELVCKRLGVRSVPERVGELIYARSDGHPFFSEELAVSLFDSGLLAIEGDSGYLTTSLDHLDNIRFPDTIQKAITSRIDRLDPAQQLSLKVSSVLGREFVYQPLHDIYPVPADRPELNSHLGRLEQLAIIGRMGGEKNGGAQYMFRNAITHDIAYNLLLYEQRRQLHRAVGEWYETQYAGDLTAYYALLAHHWQKSTKPLKAVQYLARAGEAALKNGAYQEAISFFGQLIKLINEHGQDNKWQPINTSLTPQTQLAVWYRQLSEACAGISDTAETIHYARKALILLDKPEPQTKLGMVIGLLRETAVQTAHRLFPPLFLGKKQGSVVHLERGKAALLLIEAYYFAAEFSASYHAGVLSLNNLDLAGLETYERVRTLSNFIVGMSAMPRNFFLKGYRELAHRAMTQSKDKEARALYQFRMGIYWSGIGRWDEMIAAHQEAIDIYRELGHSRMEVECLTNFGVMLKIQGEFEPLRNMGQNIYQLAERNGSQQQKIWGLNTIAFWWLHQAEGLLEAKHILDASGELMAKEDMPEFTLDLYQSWMAQFFLQLGDLDKARQAIAGLLRRIGTAPVFSSAKFDAYTIIPKVYLTIWEQNEKSDTEELAKKVRAGCATLSHYAFFFPIGRPRASLYWGLYHWLSGRKGLANYFWRRALSRAEKLEMRYEKALALYEIGRHLPPGDEVRLERLQQAASIFTTLGTTYELSLCEAELGK